MDIFGTASTAIELSLKIGSYLKDVANAEDECNRLYEEISSVENLFEDIRRRFGRIQNGPPELQRLFEHDGPVTRLLSVLEEITNELENARKASDSQSPRAHGRRHLIDNTKRFYHMFTWPFRKEDVLAKQQSIHQNVGILNAAIGAVGTGTSLEIKGGVETLLEQQKRTEFEHLLNWLCPVDFVTRSYSAKHQPALGTTRWFLDGAEYAAWVGSRGNPSLVCHGIQGSGKTILATAAYHDTLARHRNDETVISLIAYCSFDQERRELTSFFLGALLRQVVAAKGEASGTVKQLRYANRNDQSISRPDSKQLLSALQEEMVPYKTIYIVMDGLDEIFSRSERLELLQTLVRLPETMRLMVTFREHLEILDLFTKNPEAGRYKLESSDVVSIEAQEADLEQYVRQRISENYLIDLFEPANVESHVQSIVKRVTERAQRMFLYAKLSMDEISNSTSLQDIWDCLQNLPKGLDDFYSQAMRRIDATDADRSIGRKVLALVSCAQTPLTSGALRHAMAVAEGDTSFNHQRLPSLSALLSRCAGLVHVDSVDHVRLAHETVLQHILGSQNSIFVNRDRDMAKICLRYLRLSDFSSGTLICDDLDEQLSARAAQFPLIQYAAAYWAVHARRGGENDVQHLIMELFRSQANVDAAVQTMWHDSTATASGWEAEFGVTGLHLASHFCLQETLTLLAAEGADINVTDCLGTTPLMYATASNHTDGIRTLLDLGADAPMVCGRGRTALHRAWNTQTTDNATAYLLLSLSTNVAINAFDPAASNHTALMTAIVLNDVLAVELILKRSDVDINLFTPVRRPKKALYVAIRRDRVEIVDLLLSDARTTLSELGDLMPSALQVAVANGRVEILQKLIPRFEDDTEAQIRALAWAIRGNHWRVFKTLVSLLDIQASLKQISSQLPHECMAGECHAKLRYLIKNIPDIDLNAQDMKGRTAMHLAIIWNAPRCLEVLLENAARPDIEDNESRLPIQYVERLNPASREEILRQLRQAGYEMKVSITLSASLHTLVGKLDCDDLRQHLVDLNQTVRSSINEQVEPFDETPLIVASRCGKADNVALLITFGADLHVRTMFNQNALYAAALEGHEETVKVLADAGDMVDVDVTYGWDAVSAIVAEHGKPNIRPSIALMLVERGAKLHDKSPGELIQLIEWAVDDGNLKAVNLLADAGAPLELKDMNGLNLRQRAQRAGYHDIAAVIQAKTRERRAIAAQNTQLSRQNTQLSRRSTMRSMRAKARTGSAAQTKWNNTQRYISISWLSRLLFKLSVGVIERSISLSDRERVMLAIIVALVAYIACPNLTRSSQTT